MKERYYKAEIIRVIDGDTVSAIIDLGFGVSLKEKLRFLDYDSPETFRPSCLEEKELGKEATRYLTERLQEYETVILKTTKDKKGKYGRILCRILLENDEDLIQTMIDKKYIKKPEWKKQKRK